MVKDPLIYHMTHSNQIPCSFQENTVKLSMNKQKWCRSEETAVITDREQNQYFLYLLGHRYVLNCISGQKIQILIICYKIPS